MSTSCPTSRGMLLRRISGVLPSPRLMMRVSSCTGRRRQACKDSYGCAYAPCIEKLSGQIFYADARHRAVDRAEAFDALDGLVHLALAHAVGEHDHRHVLRLGRLLYLDDRFDADAGIGQNT